MFPSDFFEGKKQISDSHLVNSLNLVYIMLPEPAEAPSHHVIDADSNRIRDDGVGCHLNLVDLRLRGDNHCSKDLKWKNSK